MLSCTELIKMKFLTSKKSVSKKTHMDDALSCPVVSCHGIVMSRWVFGLHVETEPLAASRPADTPTLPLSGRPHTRTGAYTSLFTILFCLQIEHTRHLSSETFCHMLEDCSSCVVAAPRIHAGLGPHHPGVGDLLS